MICIEYNAAIPIYILIGFAIGFLACSIIADWRDT